jgi:serine/threonine protein kinase
MHLSSSVVFSILYVATLQSVCKTPEDIAFEYPELAVDKSIFHMVETALGDSPLKIINSRIVPLDLNGRRVAAKVQKVRSKDGEFIGDEEKRLFKQAVHEAKHLEDFQEFHYSEFGYLSPELIACESDVAFDIDEDDKNVRTEYIYVIILTDLLDGNFEDDSKAQTKSPILKELRSRKPIDRLKVYLKLVRSLENMMMLNKVHGEIHPGNIVATSNLKVVNIVDYGFTHESQSVSPVEGTLLFFDIDRARAFYEEKLNQNQIVDENLHSIDIWSVGLTIHILECYATGQADGLMTPSEKTFDQDITSNIQMILSEKQNECFAKSKITELLFDGGKNIQSILSEMLETDRSKRQVTARDVARKLLALITATEKGFEEQQYKDVKEEPFDEFYTNYNSIFDIDWEQIDLVFQHRKASEEQEKLVL